MKNKVLAILLATVAIVVSACQKQQPEEPQPPRELSVPEQVETDLLDVLSRDWDKLADTLSYFNENFLTKGKTSGKGPDGVYYELDMDLDLGNATVRFNVEDSTFLYASGTLNPVQLEVVACKTTLAVAKISLDSTAVSVDKVTVVAPDAFLFVDNKTANLYYDDVKVGYIEKDTFENVDYSEGRYFVVRYFNDSRSFSLYDTGFFDLMAQIDALQ